MTTRMNAAQDSELSANQQDAIAGIERAAKKPRARKFTRPTTPEVEALYFKVAVKLTQREQALFMYAMGRSGDGGEAFLDLVLHPSGDPA